MEWGEGEAAGREGEAKGPGEFRSLCSPGQSDHYYRTMASNSKGLQKPPETMVLSMHHKVWMALQRSSTSLS